MSLAVAAVIGLLVWQPWKADPIAQADQDRPDPHLEIHAKDHQPPATKYEQQLGAAGWCDDPDAQGHRPENDDVQRSEQSLQRIQPPRGLLVGYEGPDN